MDGTIHLLTGDVIRAVAYFDVFKYPLTNAQICQYLPRNSAAQDSVSTIIRRLVAEGVLGEDDEYYFLSSEDRAIVAERRADERRAASMMAIARMVSWLLKQFPFTRAVFITGSLSKNVAAEDADIDFLIVTAPGRLWICKTILTFFRKTVLLGSHKYFCTNFYISEHDYALPERNLYAAVELLTTKVMWNVPAFMEYQEANAWAHEFLPNCSPAADDGTALSERRSLLQRLLEGVLELFPLSALNSLLMDRFTRHWAKRYSGMTEERRNAAFRTAPNASTVWETDYQTNILERYRRKLADLGCEDSYD